MRILTTLVLLLTVIAAGAQPLPSHPEAPMNDQFSLVIHGGAGTILPKNIGPEKQEEYRKTMKDALERGYAILEKGGSAVDAVEAVIMILEDSPLFNAGRGSVLTNTGSVEMDASIMDGEGRQAGAVAGVTRLKNPIKAARAVMDESPHVMLSGEGADIWGEEYGGATMDQEYFKTEKRVKQWKRAQKREQQELDHDGDKGNGYNDNSETEFNDEKFGTVGCAALDRHGNLAAGTSTGGMTNKRYGRIGDSPIIAAGTYANNKTCAVSSTGHGEYFIRGVVAYDISAMMEYRGISLEKAAKEVIQNKLPELGGRGGIIATDNRGNVIMEFNTKGMFRGYVKQDGNYEISIFGEGPLFKGTFAPPKPATDLNPGQ